MYTVLIVDDNPTICQGLKELLPWNEDQMEVIGTAANGREALAILTTSQVDILITDVKMPIMDGIDLIRNLVDRGITTRRIILSAFNDFDYVRRAAVYGIENYLLKPVEADELRNTLLSTIDKIQFESSRSRIEAEGVNILRENILSRWVGGSIELDELKEKGRFLKLDLTAGYYKVELVACTDQPAVPEQWAALWRETAILPKGVRAEAFKDVPGNLILLLSGDSPDSLVEASRNLLSHFRIQLAERGAPLFVHRSSDVIDSVAMVHEAYLEVIHVSDQQSSVDTETRHTRSAFIAAKVLEYIGENYTHDINLKTVAYELGMNAFYLGQIFRSVTGDTFTNRLNSVRIAAAKELLLNRDNPRVSEVAATVGYSNPNYFFTVFKKYTGVTPAAFQLGGGN